jgi:mercuric ion transport protein
VKELTPRSLKKRFYATLAGTAIVAICCFTPLLVILFAAVGLSAFTPYFDYVLFPALVILIILTIHSYWKWKKSQGPVIHQRR